jgi:hypothetical protein
MGALRWIQRQTKPELIMLQGSKPTENILI